MFECKKYAKDRNSLIDDLKIAGYTGSFNGTEGLREIFTSESPCILNSLDKIFK